MSQPATRKKSNKGTLISIEGLDGAGKSTAINSLKTVLPNFHSVKVYREPGGTLVSEIIRSVLKGTPYPDNNFSSLIISDQGILLLKELAENTHNPKLRELAVAILSGNPNLPVVDSELSPADELWLFNIARAQLIEDLILPELDSGKTIILDRFIDSTVAYQGCGRGLDPEFVKEQCLQVCLGAVPDLTFYLRIKPETRHERMSRRENQDRIEKSGNDFFDRVAHGFDAIAIEEDRIITIDAEKTRAQVQYQILESIEKLGI